MTAPSASETETPIRGVERIVPTVSTLEGGGFQVLRRGRSCRHRFTAIQRRNKDQ